MHLSIVSRTLYPWHKSKVSHDEKKIDSHESHGHNMSVTIGERHFTTLSVTNYLGWVTYWHLCVSNLNFVSHLLDCGVGHLSWILHSCDCGRVKEVLNRVTNVQWLTLSEVTHPWFIRPMHQRTPGSSDPCINAPQRTPGSSDPCINAP